MSAGCMRLHTHQVRGKFEGGEGADRIALLVAHRRNVDFQFRHADSGELGGDAQLFVQRQRHAGRLFAVARGGVVDGDELRLAHGNLLPRQLSKDDAIMQSHEKSDYRRSAEALCVQSREPENQARTQKLPIWWSAT